MDNSSKVAPYPHEERVNGKEKRNRLPRHRAELWDQMQFFFQKYNDHQLHCAIFFEDQLDVACMEKAVLLTTDMIPVLKSRFVEARMRPYWESIHTENDEVVTFVDSCCLEEEVNSFLTGKTEEFKGPQLKARIIRSLSKDTLCIVMNHMICDGAGFKEYLYLLSSLYTGFRRDPDYMPQYETKGDRSLGQVFKQIHLADKLKLLLIPNHMAKHNSGFFFPLSGEADLSPSILTYKLTSSRFHIIREYGKKHHATINDIVLAAYLRALCKVLDIKSTESIAIPCMIDLRRFLPDRKAGAVCNLTSTIICDIGPELGDSFDETLMKVKCDMDKKKSNLPGLNGLFTLDAAFKLLPYSRVRKVMEKIFVNPSIAMTNIGAIDKNKLSFDNLRIEDAFITGSIKYPPYFQLALTSFNDSITFSINLYGSESDKQKIKSFFTLLDHELPGQVRS